MRQPSPKAFLAKHCAAPFFSIALVLASCFSTAHAQTAKAVAASARVSAGVNNGQRTSLSHVVPAYAQSTELQSAAVPDDTQMGEMTVLLQRAPAVQAAFDQLLRDQLDPSSSRYHQWLQPGQVGELYGVAPADVAAVVSWLQTQGLAVTSVGRDGMTVNFKGTARQVSQTFQTQLKTFALANGETRYSAVSEPTVPAALSAVVQTVVGLSQVMHYPSSQQTVVQRPESMQEGDGIRVAPQYTGDKANTTHYLLAGDFNTIYNVTGAANSGYTGTGTYSRVAIVGRSRVNSADITGLQAVEGLASKLPNEIIPTTGADPGAAATTYGQTPASGDQGEQTLDVNRVNGTAPGADIDLIVSADTNAAGTNTTIGTSGLYIAMNYAINTVNDPILSISYGGCENLNGSALTAYEDSMFQTAASQGITVFVSSGDDGAASCNAFSAAGVGIPTPQVASINDLCASSYATCVGGTQFIDTASPSTYWSSTNNSSTNASALSYIPEGAWNEIKTSSTTGWYEQSASGGGVSAYITRPSWQTGTGVLTSTTRVVPDVSFSAASHDGYLAFMAYANMTGYVSIFSGTSAAAPSMAGVQAVANQKLGARQGSINAKLYSLAANTANSVFHDATVATSGVTNCVATTPSVCNNSSPTNTSLTGGLSGYLLTTGWDAVTGWGSMNVNNYLTALSAAALTTSTTAVTLTPSTITVGGTTSLKATVTGTGGTPSGTVQFQSNGSNLGSAATLSSGSATVTSPTFATAGTYSITAVYSGDTTFATSTSAAQTLTVSSLPATTTTLTPASSSITALQTDVLAINVTSATAGTIGGTVTIMDGAATLGTATVTAGVATYTIAAHQLSIGAHSLTAVYGGSASYAGSTSAVATVTVTGIATTTALTPVSASLSTAQTVSFTATVAGAGGTPSNIVTFYDGATSLGTGTLNSSGVATFTSSTFTAGTHNVTAVYGGDATFASSTSNTSVLTVTAATVTLTSSTSSLTLTAGATTGNTATITSAAAGYSGNVALTCAVSSAVTYAPTCTVSPTSVTAVGGTATVTVSTQTRVTTGVTRVAGLRAQSLVLAGVLLMLPFTARKKLRRVALLVVLFGAAAAGLTGCGGGGNAPVTHTTTGTPAGTYSVTVTGTAAGVTTGTATISVTVN